MTKKESRLPSEDGETWELADDVPTRPMGAIVSVRFDANTAQKVRLSARSLGLTLSEFVRRAALAASKVPEVLGSVGDSGRQPYLIITGNRGNIVWQADGDPALGESTIGGAVPNPVGTFSG